MPDGDSGMLPPPGVPPELYSSWLNQQRQQQLAKALMSNALTPLQAPETTPVRGLYVQPRIGALSAASKIADALLGNKAQNQAMQSQIGLNQAIAGTTYAPGDQPVPGTGVPLQAAQPQSQTGDPNEQSVQPIIQRAPGASLAQTVQNTQPQTTPTNPRNPWGLPGDVVARMAMTDPAGYAKYLQGPESVQLGRVAGLSPQQAAQAAFTKQTSIEQRPGSTIIDPVSGRIMVGADPSRGEYYVTGPNGQVTAMPITNDATLQAWRTGLTTAATQANTPRETPMGAGISALRYPGQVPGLGNPPALQGGGMPGSMPQPGGAPGAAAPPNVGAAPAPAPPGAAPQGPPAPRAPMAAAGTPAPTGAWANIPKLQIPSSPGQTSNDFQTGVLKDAAAKHSELVNTYGQQTALADQQLQYNAQALKALPNAEVGPMSEWLTTNKQRLVEAGVPASVIPDSGTVTPTLELNKYLKNAALQGARSIYGNRMTQNEVQLQTQEMSPSTHMTAGAIQSLIQQGNIQAQYQKQRAADYSNYRSMNGDPQQFESWYATNRPLTRFAAAAQTPTTPGKDGLTPLQRLQAHPQMLPAFKSTFGWDPTQ
jgi:hypothetical protein